MKINGEERPISIGLNQSIEYCEQNNCSITQYNDDIGRMAKSEGTGREIRDLIWSALKAGAIAKGLKFEHTPYEVGDWMEQMTPEDMSTFMQELTDSMPKEKPSKKKAVVSEQK